MSEGTAPPNRWRRLLLTLLIASIAIYIVLIGAIYAAQGRLIYPAPKAPGSDVPGFETISYPTSDGLELRAGFRPARPGMPTILYFHGNGAHWQSSVMANDRLVAEGYGLFAAEYRGYRGNPGKPDEQGLYRDGRAAIAWLRARGVEPGQLMIAGNSLGAGVAAQMAVEHTPHALVLVSPFTSLPRIRSERMPWAPVDWLLRDRYANDEKIGDVAAPILLLHGDADTLIPPHHSRILAKANPDAKLLIVGQVGHQLAWSDEAKLATLAFLESLSPR